jgi:hypothetical protein
MIGCHAQSTTHRLRSRFCTGLARLPPGEAWLVFNLNYVFSSSGYYLESIGQRWSAGESLSVPKLYHIRHPTRWSLGPPVCGPLPCRRAQS